jgi:hypothetical protein
MIRGARSTHIPCQPSFPLPPSDQASLLGLGWNLAGIWMQDIPVYSPPDIPPPYYLLCFSHFNALLTTSSFFFIAIVADSLVVVAL